MPTGAFLFSLIKICFFARPQPSLLTQEKESGFARVSAYSSIRPANPITGIAKEAPRTSPWKQL
ncbi:MAG TPA: hypothetical protein VF492_08455, partial [Verrucomicrobiae bacterium]